jgi:hypothetical protein
MVRVIANVGPKENCMPTIKQDEAKFSAYQEVFVQELVGIVKVALADSNVKRSAEAKQLTNDIAFAVAAFFDGGGDDCSVGG